MALSIEKFIKQHFYLMLKQKMLFYKLLCSFKIMAAIKDVNIKL